VWRYCLIIDWAIMLFGIVTMMVPTATLAPFCHFGYSPISHVTAEHFRFWHFGDLARCLTLVSNMANNGDVSEAAKRRYGMTRVRACPCELRRPRKRANSGGGA
jgi:hypothetical protein